MKSNAPPIRTVITGLLLLIWLPAAQATVGHSETTDILGYEPVDEKVYVLLPGDYPGDVPRLAFFPLGNDDLNPQDLVKVESWYKGDPREVEDEVYKKLEKLQKRLTPLDKAELQDIELGLEYGTLELCPRYTSSVTRSEARKALTVAKKRGYAGQHPTDLDDPGARLVSICREVQVHARWDGLVGETSISTWGEFELTGAWKIPGQDARLIRVRHKGVTREVGYHTETLILLLPPRDDEETQSGSGAGATPTPDCGVVNGQWLGSPPPHVPLPGSWIASPAPELFVDTLDRSLFKSDDAHAAQVEITIVGGEEVQPHSVQWVIVDGVFEVAVVALRPQASGYCVLGGIHEYFGGSGIDVLDVHNLQLPGGISVVQTHFEARYRGQVAGGAPTAGDIEEYRTVLAAGPGNIGVYATPSQ